MDLVEFLFIFTILWKLSVFVIFEWVEIWATVKHLHSKVEAQREGDDPKMKKKRGKHYFISNRPNQNHVKLIRNRTIQPYPACSAIPNSLYYPNPIQHQQPTSDKISSKFQT